jgi:glutaredoxin 3
MLLEKAVFKMYSKSGCPYCDEAKDLILTTLQNSLHIVDITNQPDTRAMVIEQTGCKTVPVIFLGDHFVGGCNDLIQLHQSGELETMILREENKIMKQEILRLRRSL